MNGTIDLSESARRLIVYGVIFYFSLFLYATIADDPTAMYATEFVFGAIAIGIGAILFREAEMELSVVMGAAVCLVSGGLLQFAYLFTRLLVFDLATSLLVFTGIGLYIYAAWYSE
ncbi:MULTISPECIES: hypothetical protein [Natrialbaceae]|uniref:hypothetical protein n=1 Tax=Natrialbaceae TaxID=1644061 RepID=UPI00207D27BF|nr:hypothetical protein [Natronococcus sp. CG52]